VKKILPQVKIGLRAIGAVYFLFGSVMLAIHATSTFYRVHAYCDFCFSWSLAWLAWRDYQRLPKTGSSGKF
jgi:hypothetical protein